MSIFDPRLDGVKDFDPRLDGDQIDKLLIAVMYWNDDGATAPLNSTMARVPVSIWTAFAPT